MVNSQSLLVEYWIVKERFESMTIKELMEVMPNETRISIFVRSKTETVYEGDILHCRSQYKDYEISWIRIASNELIIDIE